MAQLMKRTLEEDFRVAVRWTEDQAQDTFQNARNSRALLQAEGIETILLVTHAWHMARTRFSPSRPPACGSSRRRPALPSRPSPG